ncbi:MAG: TIGR03960 family B12-binding radical SAM protein [Fidelibacterota bacterium]
MNIDIGEILETRVLPLVTKPGRYIGGEINAIVKDPPDITLSIALGFPDVYEIGSAYLGFKILYHIINSQKKFAAERVFAPWIDMEKWLRKLHIPLFSLETKRPLKDFDVIGFTLPSELNYTNVINMLDLSQLPLLSMERDDSHPLIIAGGICAYNPEPLADFLDAVIIGDGEEIIVKVLNTIVEQRSKRGSRESILSSLASIEGVYVPGYYRVTYLPNGRINSIKPINRAAPEKIRAVRVSELKNSNYPESPVIPLIETTHDRLTLEIARGCTKGCRFCNSGMIYRPVRERAVNDLEEFSKSSLKLTGYEEMSLSSLSTSDYSGLVTFMLSMKDWLEEHKISVSFPSMRIDSFSRDIAEYARLVRKSGLTFAPEAGSERLRNVINKQVSENDLLNSVELALKAGWKLLKFYFMIGHPTERTEDLDGIIDTVNKVLTFDKKYKGLRLNVTISPFVPKPHTPFQWESQESIEQTEKKIDYLRKRVASSRIELKLNPPFTTLLEGILSRGDRRLSRVLMAAWKGGAKFDAWKDQLNIKAWQEAFQKEHTDPQFYLRERDSDEILPWDHIDCLISRKFLLTERDKAYKASVTIDCREKCTACGVCDFDKLTMLVWEKDNVQGKEPGSIEVSYYHEGGQIQKIRGKSVQLHERNFKYRLRYRKEGSIRFVSHQDVIKIFRRAVSRAEVPVSFSRGFNPRPKISFGPPLPLGYTSGSEYCDMLMDGPSPGIKEKLNRHLPSGIEITEVKEIPLRFPSISSAVNLIMYEIDFKNSIWYTREARELKKRLLKNDVKSLIDMNDEMKAYIDEMEIDSEKDIINLSLRLIEGRTIKIDYLLSFLHSSSGSINKNGLKIFKSGQTAEKPMRTDGYLRILKLLKIHRKEMYVVNESGKFTPLEITRIGILK